MLGIGPPCNILPTLATAHAKCCTGVCPLDQLLPTQSRSPTRSAGLQVSQTAQLQPRQRGPITDFVGKIKLAWRIFFPERPAAVSPKDAVKQRLRMILVADRCGMSPASMTEMKKTICKALDEYVEIESEDRVHVNVTSEPDMGTVYYVAVPVKRVKADQRNFQDMEGSTDGIHMEWDPENPESDPAGRFPYGT